ncbi:MAG TPA: L,D-transpeptidase family protein [Nocardioidaceae bacterium]|jgi:hypothetical protein|nr:L,D-transpeptidase family protein [Actinomycetota bacterium]HEV8055580.1 L,D-transpeptidase family protein [Nocardioidaceae bacterium]
MKKLSGGLVVAVVALVLALVAPGTATGAGDGFSMRDRFAREQARHGDNDASPYSIEHVTELQYRLKRVNLMRGVSATGYYGDVTRRAVKTFQRRVGLKASGVATHKTWSRLIQRSNRNLDAARRRCDGGGWHVCYDRNRHQATLWRNGRLWNSWLVRGGAADSKTRKGANAVYYRDRDHVSGMFDDAPMPFSQFFDGGQALHGSRSMMDPWVGHSHGCINMYVEDARQLWRLTHKRRLVVHVYGAWD